VAVVVLDFVLVCGQVWCRRGVGMMRSETRRMETRRENDLDLWIMLVIVQISK